jgi:uncharacterized membrane protein
MAGSKPARPGRPAGNAGGVAGQAGGATGRAGGTGGKTGAAGGKTGATGKAAGSPGQAARPGGAAGKAGRPAASRQNGQNGQAAKGAGRRPATGSAANTRPGQAGSGARAGRAGEAAAARSDEAAARPATAAGPRWLPLTTFILSLVGLGLSVYLTYTHYTDTAPAGCPANATFNCVKVTTSPESIIFGIFPVAVLGLAFYVFMTAINSPWAWRLDLDIVRWARLAGVITGIAFVLYLVYVELLKVDAICEYCTGVHIITFLLFGLIMFSTASRSTATGKAVTP